MKLAKSNLTMWLVIAAVVALLAPYLGVHLITEPAKIFKPATEGVANIYIEGSNESDESPEGVVVKNGSTPNNDQSLKEVEGMLETSEIKER